MFSKLIPFYNVSEVTPLIAKQQIAKYSYPLNYKSFEFGTISLFDMDERTEIVQL